LPTFARESNQAVQVGCGITDLQSTKSASEAIDVLKNRLQQGIAIDSYMYAAVLKRCVREEDLTAVNECIVESGMQQNIFMANSNLNARPAHHHPSKSL
jgi:hypothetical protein